MLRDSRCAPSRLTGTKVESLGLVELEGWEGELEVRYWRPAMLTRGSSCTPVYFRFHGVLKRIRS